jgi:hypothetical protein
MADDSKNGTTRYTGALDTKQVIGASKCVTMVSTVEVTAAASANSIYTMFRIPAHMRIMGRSTIYWDDLASTGAPTLDVGLKAVDANITSDVDALNDGLDCATAAGSASVVKDIANYGKEAWRHVNGQTTNPGGFLDVTVAILDAATNTGGTITVELIGYID